MGTLPAADDQSLSSATPRPPEGGASATPPRPPEGGASVATPRAATLDLGRDNAESAHPILAEALAALLDQQGCLLHKFRNPDQLKLQQPGWLSFDPVKGPAAYRRVWIPQALRTHKRFSTACSFHEEFHEGYRQSVKLALAGDEQGLEQGAHLGRALEAHMAWEEATVYPELTAFLGEDRVARELGYEHQGLRAALRRWPDFLECCKSGNSTRKQVESFELDLLHLFEHHVEREEDAVYPIVDRLPT